MTKSYELRRQADGRVTILVYSENPTYALPHIMRHSPDGFEMGYGGSGPADSALSILADYFGEHPSGEELRRGEGFRCLRCYQAFKRDFIAAVPRLGGSIGAKQIDEWLNGLPEEDITR